MSNKTRITLSSLLLVAAAALLTRSWPLEGGMAPPGARRAGDEPGVSAGQPSDAVLLQRSEIAGVVRSSDTAGPIPGARVCAACASCEPTSAPPALCTHSARDGRYTLSQLTAAGYHVGAFAHGYRPGSAGRGQPLFVAAAECRDAVDIELAPGGALLSGHVLDATGGSVPFARVRAVRLSPPRVSLDVDGDDSGRFSFSLDPGPVSLIAEAAGYTQARATAVAPNRAVELRLVPAATIEGSVVTAQALAPVAGVEVRAAPASRPNSALFPGSPTGESGEFRLEGLAPGSYALSAKGEHVLGRLLRPIELEVADHVRGVVIEVGAAASVRGRVVVEREDTPCREGLVALGEPSPLQQQPTAAEVESAAGLAIGPEQVADIRPDGSVLFAGVPPGSYFASVRCTGHRFRTGPTLLTVGREPIADLVWVVTSGARLRVRVVDSRGAPLADTPLFLRWPANDARARPISAHRSDAAGSFEIAGLAPGDYDVLPGVGRGAAEGVHVTVRETDRLAEVVLALPASGRILVEVHDETGAPVYGVRVTATEVVPKIVAAPPRPRREHGLELGEGRYRIGPIRQGEYQLTADDGLNPASEALVRVQDSLEAEHRFVVSRGGGLRGIVLDEAGEPLPDVWVGARAMQPEAATPTTRARPVGLAQLRRAQQRVLTDRQGHFSIPGVAPSGRYVVRASPSHGPAGNAAVRSNVDPREWIELRVQPPAAVSGVVVDGAGRPVPGYRLQLAHSASDLQQSTEIADPSGQFSLSDMPAGPLQLVAVTPAGRVGTLQLDLSPGQRQTDVRLALMEDDAVSSAAP